MENKKMEYHLKRLKEGKIYWDKKHKEKVEFGYMGQTGLAIVYEPGDSGGGMQSSWGIDPDYLEDITNEQSLLNEKQKKELAALVINYINTHL